MTAEKKLRVVFMGTPAFAVPTLQALIREHEVAAVLTQPDRPAGRGKKMNFSPVKEAALAAGIEILQPQTLFVKRASDGEAVPVGAAPSGDVACPHSPKAVRARLKEIAADVFVVAAYGLILPKAVFNMPRLGCINVHASLLPKYRGSSPIHAAILAGDTHTGVTIQHIAEGIDTGDMILSREMPIAPDEHFPSVHDRMAELGAQALLDALTALAQGTAPRTPQDNTLATHAPMIAKADGQIDWTRPTAEIINKIRAFDPWPGAYTMLDGSPLKILRAKSSQAAPENTLPASPGTILSADKHGLTIRTANGALLATELQGANTKKMPAGDYLRGREIAVGTKFEP